jgi:hypothetical protein
LDNFFFGWIKGIAGITVSNNRYVEDIGLLTD